MLGQLAGEDEDGQGAVVPLLQETLPHPAVLAHGCVGRGIEDQIRDPNVADRGICDVHFDTSFNESDVLRAGAAFAGRKYAFRAGSAGESLHTPARPSLSKIERQNFEKDIMSVFIKSITTKANEWEYEKEWRIIRDKGACGSAWKGDGIGAELPSIKPKSVILGCEAQGEFELRVRAYCEDCRVDLYKMEKDEKEYKLNKKPVLLYSKQE